MVKPNREDCHDPAEGWSGWVRAIVPGEDLDERHYTERNGTGYYCNNIKTVFDNEGCGIYEWKAVHDQRDYVVYVGRTCQKDCGPLKNRIMDYCKHGSHKEEEINRALGMGYELHVRVKEIGCAREGTRDAEKKMLDTYNYAWNKSDNSQFRVNIPPPLYQLAGGSLRRWIDKNCRLL